MGILGSLFATNPRTISDAVIGISDGLTVPFALTAGLAALGDTRFIVQAGLAELVAGSISMGIGGYLSASSDRYEQALVRLEVMTDANHDRQQQRISEERHQADIELSQDSQEAMLYKLLSESGVSATTINALLSDLQGEQKHMNAILRIFDSKVDDVNTDLSRVWCSALTIAGGYFLGGLVPLVPYMLCRTVITGLAVSAVCSMTALFTFGYCRSKAIGEVSLSARLRDGVQMLIFGSMAAMICMVIMYKTNV